MKDYNSEIQNRGYYQKHSGRPTFKKTYSKLDFSKLTHFEHYFQKMWRYQLFEILNTISPVLLMDRGRRVKAKPATIICLFDNTIGYHIKLHSHCWRLQLHCPHIFKVSSSFKKLYPQFLSGLLNLICNEFDILIKQIYLFVSTICISVNLNCSYFSYLPHLWKPLTITFIICVVYILFIYLCKITFPNHFLNTNLIKFQQYC